MAFSNIARTVISIHAPPRGATKEKTYFFTGRGISIHAPPRGATKLRTLFLGFLQHFNSRPSARGDFPSPAGSPSAPISIHAPPRGATSSSNLYKVKSGTFQFTPLREGRRNWSKRSSSPRKHFNSRPSARGDRIIVGIMPYYPAFQFTPLREGRHA